MNTTDDTNAARQGSESNDLLGLLARLQSLKVLLGTDSPEVRGWAPVVQQGAQATVNAAIAAFKPLTAQQLDKLIEAHVGGAELADGEYSAMVLFAAAVERAHGIGA